MFRLSRRNLTFALYILLFQSIPRSDEAIRLETYWLSVYGEKPADGWAIDDIELLLHTLLDCIFAPGPDWIDWLRTTMKDYPFHTPDGQNTVALQTGAMSVGSQGLEWYERYVSLYRLMAQGIEGIAGFPPPSDIEDSFPITPWMFYEQGLVKVVSGLSGGKAAHLGDVVLGILDVPPISGRGDASNYMHVSLVDLYRWSGNVRGIDPVIRMRGDGYVSGTVCRSLAERRATSLSYHGARRVYFALLETILLLEQEGNLGFGGGLDSRYTVRFPDAREPLPPSDPGADGAMALFLATAVGFSGDYRKSSASGAVGGRHSGTDV